MIIRPIRSNFLYEVDSTVGTQATPNPTPETVQGTNTGEAQGEKKKPEPISLTLGQLKKRLDEAKGIATKQLLESLGVSDEASLKTLVDSYNAKANADKTEAQKLSERLASLERQLQEKEQKLSESENRRRNEKRDSELKALLSKAHEPNDVLTLIKAKLPEKIEALLDEDGNFDTEAASKLVTDYQSANPFLFKDMTHGSSLSNRDGHAPQGNEEAKKALANMTAKSLKGF